MVRFLKKLWKPSKKPVLSPEDSTHQITNTDVGTERARDPGENRSRLGDLVTAGVADRTDLIVGPDTNREGGSRIANLDEGVGNQRHPTPDVSTLTHKHEGGNACDLRERQDGGPGAVRQLSEIAPEPVLAGDLDGGDAHDIVQSRTPRGRLRLLLPLEYSPY